jgi:uncharacterized protein YcnI
MPIFSVRTDVLLAPSVLSYVLPKTKQAPIESSFKAAFSVSQGCRDNLTAKICSRIRKDVVGVKPKPKVRSRYKYDERDYAVASWLGQEGHVLPARVDGEWQVHTRGGNGRNVANALEITDMSAMAVRHLVNAVGVAEVKLSQQTLQNFSSACKNLQMKGVHHSIDVSARHCLLGY